MSNALQLQDLIRPLSVHDFVTRHWIPGTPFLSDVNPDLVQRVRRLDALRGTDAVLKRLTGDLILFGPNKLRATVAAREARTFLAHGFTLYVPSLERSIPELESLTPSIKAELGIPDWGVTFECFVSQPGSLSSVHYDHDINFQILLEGEKQWKVAPNEHIHNPLFPFHPTEAGSRVFLEEAYARDPDVPLEIPPGALDLRASAGSVLFLPRGYWHEVRSATACLALNIVVTGMTWSAGIARALQRRLNGDESARGYVCGVLASSKHLETETLSSFEAVRSLAIDHLRRLTMEEVFLTWPDASFRWCDRAKDRAVRERDGEWTLVVPGALDEPIALDEPLVAMMKKLCNLRHTFHWEHVLHLAGDDPIPREGVWNLLVELEARELIEKLPPRDRRP